MVLAFIKLLEDWGTDAMAGKLTTAPQNDRVEAFNSVLTNAQEVIGVSRFGRAQLGFSLMHIGVLL